MKHKLKIIENYADRIISGEKTFEVRYNDRDYQVGDIIEFDVVNGNVLGLRVYHPLEHHAYKIIYVHSGLGMEKGYVVLGIEEISEVNKNSSEKVDGFRESQEERPNGKWIVKTDENNKTSFKCSKCATEYRDFHNYCPNCGGYMRDSEVEE